MSIVQKIRLTAGVLTSVATLTVFFVSIDLGFNAMLHVLQAIAIVWSTYVIVKRHRGRLRFTLFDPSVNHYNLNVVLIMLWMVSYVGYPIILSSDGRS